MKREQFAMAGLAQALSRAKEDHPMYEDFYGFAEKPFSLTPDPKFFYRSESHGNAFDVLQYAIRRREGFVVITGDSGTGKTTLCRALLAQLDRRTFTALVLNPFVSEEDLLRLILQDFGLVSREDVRKGRLAGVTKQELINTLNDFLHSIRSIGGRAMLIVDEAQNLPLQLLEQIRLLSNLETDKDKLLQIVLVGQLSLKETLRSPELRQLDQRVSVRYQLRPLTPEETAAYVFHRLTIAGGGSLLSFTPKALQRVHRFTNGVPRLINLVCDRALLSSYALRLTRIMPEIVDRAAHMLDLEPPRQIVPDWLRRRTAALVMAGIAAGLSAATLISGSSQITRLAQFDHQPTMRLPSTSSTPTITAPRRLPGTRAALRIAPILRPSNFRCGTTGRGSTCLRPMSSRSIWPTGSRSATPSRFCSGLPAWLRCCRSAALRSAGGPASLPSRSA